MNGQPTKSRSRKGDVAERGRAELGSLRRMSDSEIDRTSPPELANLPEDFWDSAVLVDPPKKEAVSIRLDSDVLGWFRGQGPRYQSRINAVLRAYMTRMREKGSVQARKRPG